MSDTAITANLASAPEFDARLKRTDEPRWLASRYAPTADRERLVALYVLHLELQRALTIAEAMIGKIRIQWWRETLAQIAGPGPVRRHDLALELARVLAGRADLLPPINALIDAYDDILDDHLHSGGHTPGADHEARHFAAEASLARLAGLSLDPDATPAHLDALAICGETSLAIAASFPDIAARWTNARHAARTLPSVLWPAIAHLAALNDRDLKSDSTAIAAKTPLKMRWRVLSAVFRRRL